MPNNELLALLAAQSRQANHEAARLLGVIAEIGRATPTFDDDAVDRRDQPVPYAADEVRAALAWSRRAADRECDLAEQLVHDLPQVHAAYLAGDLDRSKVRVFADHLSGLTEAQIITVCAVLLPQARRLTPGQLVARLRRLVAAIDTRHYERRYHKALRDRTVCAWLDENGTAVLCARGLSPAQAQAAVERIDLLAHAARRAGHPSTLDQIRVDILAGLLDGTLHYLDRDQIITHLLAHRPGNDDPPPPDPGDDNLPPSGPGDDQATHAGVVGASYPTSTGDDQRVGIEVRVALSALLGHDEQPGEIPGLGPVPASHARAVVARQHRAEWRYAITDDIGRPLFDGVTRRRPTGRTTTGPPGGIVELHVPAALLATLTNSGEDAGPGVARWAGLLADIARQYRERDRRDLDAHPDDRLPRAALRRHTQIRDRTCVGIGCRHRPTRCDQDHTVDHRYGGPTVAAGLAPLCRHDHTLKGQAGWPSDNRAPARSSGPAHSAGDIRSAPSPSCRCPTPVPDPTTISMISPPHKHRIRSRCGSPTHPRRRRAATLNPPTSTPHHRSEHRAQPAQESTAPPSSTGGGERPAVW